ncbi:MAG TPA: hypothetical protein VMU54_03580 [Planctomycetota bacterium]|nr:hypothetical protein [Planctomycetota bacterium]
MGREIVYCWKCATRLQGTDFESGSAFRVGDKVSCPDCIEELIADLSAEEQEAILHPPRRKEKSQSIKKITGPVRTGADPAEVAPSRKGATSVRTRPATAGPAPKAKTGTTGPVTKMRTGTTGPVPTTAGASTGARKRVTASIPKVPPVRTDEGEEGQEGGTKPPMDEKKKKLLLLGGIGGGLFLLIVVLLVLVLTKKEPKKAPAADPEETKAVKTPAVAVESPKAKQIKALLKEGFDLKAKDPNSLGPQLKKFQEASAAAEGTTLAADTEAALDDVRVRIDKAVGAIDDQVKPQWTSNDFKAVLEAYEKAKDLHDFPEWKDKLDKKLSLTRNKMDDTFYAFKKQAEDARQNGEEAKIKELKDAIAKWESAEYAEKFEKFLQLMAASDTPDPGKAPDPTKTAPALKPLSPAMKAFLPAWTEALVPALGRDFGAAATALTGAGARAESDEAKKAASEDAQAIRDLGELYPEVLKTVGQTARLQTFTLEYQDQPGVWKKLTGKTLKVDPTRIEFKPDAPKDAKDLPAIFIEITDLNAGSLADLYRAKKKTLSKKESDLLTRFCLLEGASEAAKGTGGSAPDRFWQFAPEARERAPKPNSREFEARVLFHQSEFEWRKSATKYSSIEKSKMLIGDYTSTAIVQKYQPQIARRADTGKEFVFLPSDLAATGDYNQFKLEKKDPAWITSKGIDFKDSLYNYIEAEFITLPNVQYRCWVYAGGCCQEVWNGSYQLSEGTTSNKGKSVSIDPGSTMAAPLPIPGGLKKTHEDHKPKGMKVADFPKTPAKWDWISIPLPKAFSAPGAKQLRILTDQQGFAVKYVIVSSTRTKAPDEALAKELAGQATSAPPTPKSEIKGTPQPKEWLIIGPFPEGLAKEEGPETSIDLSAELKGKTGPVKWKIFNSAPSGTQTKLDWEKNVFTPKDNVSAYALIHIKAPAATECRLYLSHDDGGRAWLNGVKIHDNNKSGVVKADEFNVPLKLEEGWNRLLFKVTTSGAGFGLLLRITDASKAPVPGLEYSPYGDSLNPP